MTQNIIRGKPPAAMLANVAMLLTAQERLENRPRHLADMSLAVLHGPSGYGKTTAAGVLASETGAAYVQACDSWRRKDFATALCVDLGLPTKGTVATLMAAAKERLAISRRTLIIDEADYAVDNGYLELVREIAMGASVPIVLIGEENLPQKLGQNERVANRVLEWLPMLPASLKDARSLAAMYVKGVEIADDLLELVLKRTHGRVRRIIVTLDDIRLAAQRDGLAVADAKWWGDRPIHTSAIPGMRRLG